jgi:hypothetical protein
MLLTCVACGPSIERWEGELDDCTGNVGDLEGRRVLLYLSLTVGDPDAEGWIGVAESPTGDETMLFTDLEDGRFDGEDLDFEADFGNINADANLKHAGDEIDGDLDVQYPFFGAATCDMTLDPLL